MIAPSCLTVRPVIEEMSLITFVWCSYMDDIVNCMCFHR